MRDFNDKFGFMRDTIPNTLERATEFVVFRHMLDYSRKEELISAGLDIEELEMMDEEERRVVVENAGLNYDDYWFN